MNKKSIHIFFVLLFAAIVTNAQPFADEIAAFKRTDSLSYPFHDRHPIVFVGSSSFRKWTNMQSDFSKFPILNRGFGGSTFPDVIRYSDDIILKYAPKQVIIYCGDNDLASADSITAKIAFERFKTLYQLVRTALPFASIGFVSIKPSPSRERLLPKVIEANNYIKKFIRHRSKAVYIDVYSAMLNNDGTINKELFIADNLHMNEKGYAIWKKIIEPYLIR